MISPLYAAYALLAGAIQLTVIWGMRARHWPFLLVIPAILVHQWLFTTAYARAPNFLLQWFLTAAVTGLVSYVLGIAAFGDRVSPTSVGGVILVMVGLAMMRTG